MANIIPLCRACHDRADNLPAGHRDRLTIRRSEVVPGYLLFTWTAPDGIFAVCDVLWPDGEFYCR